MQRIKWGTVIRVIVYIVGFWVLMERIPTHQELRDELQPIKMQLDAFHYELSSLNSRVEKLERK